MYIIMLFYNRHENLSQVETVNKIRHATHGYLKCCCADLVLFILFDDRDFKVTEVSLNVISYVRYVYTGRAASTVSALIVVDCFIVSLHSPNGRHFVCR